MLLLDKDPDQVHATIEAKHYRLQLMRLSLTIREKRTEITVRHVEMILQHNNAPLHMAVRVKNYPETLKSKVQNLSHTLQTLLFPTSGIFISFKAILGGVHVGIFCKNSIMNQ